MEELFEGRSPKTPAVIAEIAGVVTLEEQGEETIVTLTSQEPLKQHVTIHEGYTIVVQNNDPVQPKDVIATREDGHTLRSTLSGTVKVTEGLVVITAKEKTVLQYTIPSAFSMKVSHGEVIERGQALNEGHIDLQQLLILSGRPAVERYIANEVQSIYASQGQSINNKHIEIIVRQMLSKVQISNPGNSAYITGQTIELTDLHEAHRDGINMQAEQLLLGITRVSLKTKSFLSAASFQETTSVLIDAAV